ncbi:Putative phage integrase (fragment) [Paraburkholderia piptadeniae]|uniref:Phage integrase n=2 Tax=Paraburkholderia TaxID=1822464 RepID=A0A1N7SXZ1_9BURK
MLRAVDALIDGAGIAASRKSRASPQTLRNTFAADLFESGVEAELVGQWLGFVQAVSANRLYRAWQTWMDQQDLPVVEAPDPAAQPLPAPRRDGRLTRKPGADQS